ncbi:molybdopterin-dependent oxidoreductase [Pararhodobacter sp.]|uniref:molybdopterin-dependent oxidoreductase n=1 Tax=Pararhodobacter sp. TaxID=2127056 RepID=UPI002FE0C4E2
MLPEPPERRIVTHWGSYRTDAEGRAVPVAEDPAPSAIGRGLEAMSRSPARVLRPMVRRGWLENGPGGGGRGREPFVPVSWDEADRLVAAEVDRVRRLHGNAAIYGGSYGWASAGRFHHAQSQIHRFLNLAGGYTRSVQNYSYAAGDVILPYVTGSAAGLSFGHTPWSEIRAHARQVLMFGGMPARNTQVNGGGTQRHGFGADFDACRAAGLRMVLISPLGDDAPACDAWLALRPTTDVALMLALAHEVIAAGRVDRAFLDRYTTGAEAVLAYVTGAADGMAKSPAWAAPITGLPEGEIRALAQSVMDLPTFIAVSWSLQRARHGEQPYWMAITLAALLGTIGKPGLGFGFGYGSIDGIGQAENAYSWPKLGQGSNPVDSFIPVARIADMLLAPGGAYPYRGETRHYPDIRLVYWAGGNPFHHHQDLNRLVRAWQRPETVIVHEPWWTATARHADIVLPATLPTERDDIAASGREPLFLPSHKIAEPPGEARDDYAILTGIARHLGLEADFTEGRSAEAWLRHLYAGLPALTGQGDLPDFEDFWQGTGLRIDRSRPVRSLLQRFRETPERHRLHTPSGRIELYSQTIAGFALPDCPGHAAWLEPEEWLGAPATARHPLHLLSTQPATRLHSQMDAGPTAQESKIRGREPLRMNPADAAARGLAAGDVVRVFNDRGACLAGLVLSEALRPGVVQLATGAWYDPVEPGGLDAHGNPNVLTRDQGASMLSQAPSAQSCLVEVAAWTDPLPPIRAFQPPT